MGTSHERGIFDGARRSAEKCYNMLKARTPATIATSDTLIDTSTPSSTHGQPLETLSGDGGSLGDVPPENLGFELLQGGGLDDIGLPDSWLFTGWEMFGDEMTS